MNFDCAFLFVDTYGLPLGIIIDYCSSQGVPVDLKKFVTDAISHGWPRRKALAVVRESLVGKLSPRQADVEVEVLRYETEIH